jgi:hypothetical protein
MAAWLQLVLLAGCVGGRIEIGEGQCVAVVFGRFEFQGKGMVVQGEVLQVEEAAELVPLSCICSQRLVPGSNEGR